MKAPNPKMGSLFLTAMLLFLVLSASAQNDSPGAKGNTATGLPENGMFEGSAFDSVQMNNGNLHLHIPFTCVSERGHNQCYLYSYDNRGWYFHGTTLKNGGTVVNPLPELFNSKQGGVSGSGVSYVEAEHSGTSAVRHGAGIWRPSIADIRNLLFQLRSF